MTSFLYIAGLFFPPDTSIFSRHSTWEVSSVSFSISFIQRYLTTDTFAELVTSKRAQGKRSLPQLSFLVSLQHLSPNYNDPRTKCCRLGGGGVGGSSVEGVCVCVGVCVSGCSRSLFQTESSTKLPLYATQISIHPPSSLPAAVHSFKNYPLFH